MWGQRSVRFRANKISWKYADALSCRGPAAAHFSNEPFGGKARDLRLESSLKFRGGGASLKDLGDRSIGAESVHQTLAFSHEASPCSIKMTAHPD